MKNKKRKMETADYLAKPLGRFIVQVESQALKGYFDASAEVLNTSQVQFGSWRHAQLLRLYADQVWRQFRRAHTTCLRNLLRLAACDELIKKNDRLDNNIKRSPTRKGKTLHFVS